ncbi:MAG: hypothetical protein HF314_16070 [Ignavibacteria bacterium]|nr:hypothetical protein [Ignavibacteria bacterium]MCU7517986.1 hypothetical protein [Ignavibacteria bacterium]
MGCGKGSRGRRFKGERGSKFKVQGSREERNMKGVGLELGMGLAPEGRFVCRKECFLPSLLRALEGRLVCSREGELPLPPSIEPWKGDLFDMIEIIKTFLTSRSFRSSDSFFLFVFFYKQIVPPGLYEYIAEGC